MTISIILTSIDRKQELARFVKSINEQEAFDLSILQLIFVDQAENSEILKSLDNRIDYHYIKYHKCSLSEARNQALPYVKNEIICFGDDDAWYDHDTFQNVIKWLQKGYDGVFGVVMNEKGQYCNIFPSDAQKLSYTNHCGGMSASMFIKFDNSIRFDENIGVGSPYNLGSGEETDYLLTYMEKHPNFKFFFTPKIVVRHPVSSIIGKEKYLEKSYSYARGTGYCLRKHEDLPFSYKMKQFLRPLGGCLLFFFTDRFKSKKSFYLFKGRLEGYFYKIK